MTSGQQGFVAGVVVLIFVLFGLILLSGCGDSPPDYPPGVPQPPVPGESYWSPSP